MINLGTNNNNNLCRICHDTQREEMSVSHDPVSQQCDKAVKKKKKKISMLLEYSDRLAVKIYCSY